MRFAELLLACVPFLPDRPAEQILAEFDAVVRETEEWLARSSDCAIDTPRPCCPA